MPKILLHEQRTCRRIILLSCKRPLFKQVQDRKRTSTHSAPTVRSNKAALIINDCSPPVHSEPLYGGKGFDYSMHPIIANLTREVILGSNKICGTTDFTKRTFLSCGASNRPSSTCTSTRALLILISWAKCEEARWYWQFVDSTSLSALPTYMAQEVQTLVQNIAEYSLFSNLDIAKTTTLAVIASGVALLASNTDDPPLLFGTFTYAGYTCATMSLASTPACPSVTLTFSSPVLETVTTVWSHAPLLVHAKTDMCQPIPCATQGCLLLGPDQDNIYSPNSDGECDKVSQSEEQARHSKH